jgi:hypothetical protein
MNPEWITFMISAASAAASAQSAHCPIKIIDAVIITQSGRPTTLSSFSLSWVAIKARTSPIEASEFYVPYMVANQFIPPSNSVCKITYHTALASGGTREGPIPSDREINIVDELSCDSGHFVMKW